MLVTAQSARAIAVSAARAGYAPLVADAFGDLDTREAASALAVLPGGLNRRSPALPVLALLERLAAGRRPVGLVYGSGYEDRLPLLRAMGRRHALLGNAPETVARVKDPFRFAALCQEHGMPHPDVRERPAGDDGAWLLKRRGGAGGGHVQPWDGGPVPKGHYLQRRAPGRPISALLLADGRRAMVLGWTVQWAAPARRLPFRWGGAARPARMPSPVVAATSAALQRLVAATGLVGLNSADFLLDGEQFTLLEINPRPGSALDAYPDPSGALFAAHVDACRGRLPPIPPRFAGANATAVVYVPRPIVIPACFTWPDWAVDRQPPESRVPAEGPLCTVLAEAETPEAARALVESRAASILATCLPPTAGGAAP